MTGGPRTLTRHLDVPEAPACTTPGLRQLLDSLLLQHLHQRGVDRLVLCSEKMFAGGTAVLEVFFDRADEAGDRFELTVLDMQNKLLRHESWTSDEVMAAARLFYDPEFHPENEPPEAAEARLARQAEREQRLAAVVKTLGLEQDVGQSCGQ